MTSSTQVEELAVVVERNLKSYGEEVVMHRAVPDFRDGLKPVHRCILWALHGLNLKHTGPFKKAARTVGEVIGKFHPHGDASVYDAMVGLAGTKADNNTWATKNTPVPLVEGFGNWGDNIDSAAAYRYTEARLSEFSCNYLLDPIYLAVTEYLPNFSEDDKIPLVLPAKLPLLLLNGSVSIAFGISAECPSFAANELVQLVIKCLKGEKITARDCLALKFNFAYGGRCISDKKTLLAFYKSGKGSIAFRPELTTDEHARKITLTSAAPGLVSKNSWTTLAKKLLAKPEVMSVVDGTDKLGFKFDIFYQKGLKLSTVLPIIEKEITRTSAFDIGVTHRMKDKVSFRRTTVFGIINDWTDWRIELEAKVLKYLISVEEKKLARTELILKAVLNLDTIIAALRAKDSVAFLVKKLKITEEDANEILDLKVRQLKSLEANKLKQTIKDIQTQIKSYTSELKNPATRIIRSLSSIETKAL